MSGLSPLRLRVSLHTRLSQWFDEAMAPALQDEELRYAALLLVDGRPVVLRGGELDLFHYALQARRQVGSVSKLFFYESVWQLGYVSPDALMSDGDMPEPLRQHLTRPLYQPRNDDGRLRTPLPHSQSLSHSVNKIAYRTTWGERTEAQRYAIARLLVERFGLPWQHGAQPSLRYFYRVFTADESVPLGTWQATPFEVAAMLEKGFRGSSLTSDHLILTWNGRSLAPAATGSSPGLSRVLFKTLRGAVAVTAPQAVLPAPAWILAAKTGTRTAGAMPGLPVFCSRRSRAARHLSVRASRSWSGPAMMTTDHRGCMGGVYMAHLASFPLGEACAGGITGSAPRQALKSCVPKTENATGDLLPQNCCACHGAGYGKHAACRCGVLVKNLHQCHEEAVGVEKKV